MRTPVLILYIYIYIYFFNISKGDFIMVINLHEELEKQKVVIDKYPFFYEREIDMIDRMSVQLIEEVREYMEAIEVDHKREELTDVLLYTLSTMCELYYNFGLEPYINKYDMQCDIRENVVFEDPKEYILDEVTSTLYSIRTKYPERKYHKPFNVDTLTHYDKVERSSLSF